MVSILWDVKLGTLTPTHLGLRSYMQKWGVEIILGGHIHWQFAMLFPCLQIEWLVPSPCNMGLTSCTCCDFFFWEEYINERKGIRNRTTCFFMFCQKNWSSPWKSWVSLKSNVKQSTQNLHTSDMVWTRPLQSNQSPWLWFNTHYWNMGLKVLVIA